MQLPVEFAAEVRAVEAGYARDADLRAIRAWAEAPRAGVSPRAQDAADYADLACEKLQMAQHRRRLARSLAEMRAAIQEAGRTAELICMLVARAQWHRPAPTLGFCLFRRTWAHNLFVDYLGTDPRLLPWPVASRINGVGTGLLYAVMLLGQQIGAGRCLVEATNESFRFYRKKFRMMEINDLLALSPAAQWHFLEKTRAAWEPTGVPLTLTFEPTSP